MNDLHAEFTHDVEPISDAQLTVAMDNAILQIRRSLPLFTFASQNHSSVNNVYPTVENNQWTSGFWPGSVWLAYEASGDKIFRYAAQIQVQSHLHRIESRISTDHHDMGFMYNPSCVAAWQLVGDKDGRTAALLAADQLCKRFHEKGEFIQAWGALDSPGNYRYIIDCLLNLPLLYWAARESGNDHYRDLARRHMATTLRHSIRDDYSTYHTFHMDPANGEPLQGATMQGYADDSSWARGQAWAITGIAFLQRLDPSPELPELFEKLLKYYLDKLPGNLVPYWDLIFTSGDEPRDSSSAAIVACGLLEMAGQVDRALAERYRNLAKRILASLANEYAVSDPAVSNGLLLHATYSKETPYNACNGEGVDECVSWGDYFYFEALTRLSRDWRPYW